MSCAPSRPAELARPKGPMRCKARCDDDRRQTRQFKQESSSLAALIFSQPGPPSLTLCISFWICSSQTTRCSEADYKLDFYAAQLKSAQPLRFPPWPTASSSVCVIADSHLLRPAVIADAVILQCSSIGFFRVVAILWSKLICCCCFFFHLPASTIWFSGFSNL